MCEPLNFNYQFLYMQCFTENKNLHHLNYFTLYIYQTYMNGRLTGFCSTWWHTVIWIICAGTETWRYTHLCLKGSLIVMSTLLQQTRQISFCFQLFSSSIAIQFLHVVVSIAAIFFVSPVLIWWGIHWYLPKVLSLDDQLALWHTFCLINNRSLI